MKKILLLAAILLSGCTSVTETYAPDGKKAYTVSCSGNMINWNNCYQKAGTICQHAGYKTLFKFDEEEAKMNGSTLSNLWKLNTTIFHKRSIEIACNEQNTNNPEVNL